MSAEDEANLLRSFLADRDVPCPVCGYNLRMLQTSTCPECGRALQLKVGTVEPRLFLYLLTLVPLLCSSGIGVLFVVLLVKEGMPHSFDWMAQLNIWLYLFLIPFAPLLLILRRRFCKLNTSAQRVMALASLILSVFLFCWMATWIG